MEELGFGGGRVGGQEGECVSGRVRLVVVLMSRSEAFMAV